MKLIEIFEPWFNEKYGDVDILNDVSDEFACAFCGGVVLNDYAKEKYSDVLQIDVTVVNDVLNRDEYNYLMCRVDALGDNWERMWESIKNLFSDVAGYCSAEEYDKLFIEMD